jgi:hypothetical protein
VITCSHVVKNLAITNLMIGLLVEGQAVYRPIKGIYHDSQRDVAVLWQEKCPVLLPSMETSP